MKSPDKRGAILKAADRIFTRQGFHGTGVDLIAAKSGVTKRTLYNHFGSKDGLIRAVLETHYERGMKRLRADVAAAGTDVRDRLLACFHAYRDWFAGSRFSGCIFIKALNEFAGCSTELGRYARDAKAGMRDLLREIASDGGIPEPEQLADELQLLLEGSIILAQCGRATDSVHSAEAVAADRIDRALQQTA